MLLRNLRPDVRKIQHGGERATGIVLAVKARPAGTSGVSRFTLTIEAQLPSGRHTTERYCDSPAFHGADPGVGDTLPLRYDPADHAKVEIDYDTFGARQKAASDRLDAERLRDARQR